MKDASRQGRYHNRHFKAIAEELGLHVTQDPPFGWTSTAVPAATADDYADTLAILEPAVSAAHDDAPLNRAPGTVRTSAGVVSAAAPATPAAPRSPCCAPRAVSRAKPGLSLG